MDQGYTKTSVLIPCTTRIDAKGTAWRYAAEVWKQFGLPQKIISDRGLQFNSKFISKLCKSLGIKQNLSTAYHSQTDGQTEHVNQELEQYLCAFCNFQQDNWSSLLPFAEFAHNIRHYSAINESPFKALMGYHPRFTDIQPCRTNNSTVEERIKLLERMREEIDASSRIAAEIVQNRAETSIPVFKKGDKVWLEGRNITTTHPSVKLAPKRHGLFTI